MKNALLLVLLVLPSLVPTAAAHHTARDADTLDVPVTPPDLPLPPWWPTLPREIPVPDLERTIEEDTDTVPAVDEMRDRALATHRGAVDALNAELARRNITLASLTPAVPAQVLHDPFNGSRVGGVGGWTVLGDHWRLDPAAGRNATGAYLMTDPDTGRYGPMDAWLVTPAIDLSAYLLRSGVLPYGSTDYEEIPRQTLTVAEGYFTATDDNSSDTHLLRDQVNLLVQHRYNLKNLTDGAQVLLFEDAPPASTREKGHLLDPVPRGVQEEGVYTSGVQAFRGERGFTAYDTWNLSVFDLTPWAGKTVWIAFRVATGQRADEPSHFTSGFQEGVDFGWQIDEVEVIAPAYGKNLKTYAVEGPRFRSDARDPMDRLAPGSDVTVRAIILNAAGTGGEAVAEIRTLGLEQEIVQRMNRTLVPGEVWEPEMTFQAPNETGATFQVVARAWNPGPGATRLPDPTSDDNEAARAFIVSVLPRLDATITVDRAMIDDGEAQRATVLVTNTGNVPLDATITLTDFHLARNATTGNRTEPRLLDPDPVTLTILPGKTGNHSWPMDATERGEHLLNLTVEAPGAADVAQIRYYVHASPAPILALDEASDFDADDWARGRADKPRPPDDDWVWYSSESFAFVATASNVLRARALPEAADLGSRYQDLRLSARYMGFYTAGSAGPGAARVSIAYAQPAAVETPIGVNSPDLFHVDLALPKGTGLASATNLSWQTLEMRVVPAYSRGYVDLWSLQGLEVRVRAPSLSAPSGIKAGFWLDDLRLTGVPEGADESQRREIVRITGAEGTTSPTVAPAAPGLCAGTTSLHCWVPKNATAEALAAPSRAWSPGDAGESHEGARVFWRYQTDQEPTMPERLVTPELDLTGASDPILVLDHAYAFPSYPVYDAPKYIIDQVGFVELQYQRDDGKWSEFTRILPDGGYPDTFGEGRTAHRNSDFNPGDGFYHPPACTNLPSASCDDGGYYGHKDEDGELRWKKYEPYRRDLSVFHLDQEALGGVDLAGRKIRLGLHGALFVDSDLPTGGDWMILGARVSPVERYAVDGTVDDVRLVTPYNWSRLGVGPGATIPVNVTIRNDGLFRESFSVRLGVSEFAGNGTIVWGEAVDVGPLGPGEPASRALPWNVSGSLDGRSVLLTAEVFPTDNRTFDEDPYDDRATLGDDGRLEVRRVVDAALVSGAFPAKADATVPRLTPITLHNVGNVPLEGLVVERRIDRLDPGRLLLVDRDVWTITETMAADPRGVNLLRLAEDARDADLSFTPPTQGTYLLTVTLRRASSPMGDASPGNDVYRQYFEAAEPLLAEDFEGRVRWDTSAPALWGEGPGFRSDKALVAMNRTSGLVPAGTDAWVTTPPLPLADAQAALVSFLTKYDLEKGYDAAVVEVSADNKTWHRLPPVDAAGRATPYPVPLVGSNPIAAGADNATGLSGSSWEADVQFDGWTPVAFDLTNAPGLSERIAFRELRAPTPGVEPVRALDPRKPAVSLAPWMVTDPADAAGRWEVRNDTVREDMARWWTDFGAANKLHRLARTFDLTKHPAGTAVVVSWWDRRAGSEEDSWTGVGAFHRFVVRHGATSVPIENDSITSTAFVDGWHRLSVNLNDLKDQAPIPRAADVEIAFEFQTTGIDASNLGWEVRNVLVEAYPAVNGKVAAGSPRAYAWTLDETAELGLWTTSWRRVNDVPARPAPWGVSVETGPDGRDAPQWKLTLDSDTRDNVDASLVSPVVDLSTVAGGRASLRLTHKHDLLWLEGALKAGERLDQRKHYQAGAVEIAVFNRTTGEWDPPRQLFAKAEGPDRDPIARRQDGRADETGAPYPRTLLSAGDTFEHYGREVVQRFDVLTGTTSYLRTFADPLPTLSYAYSGDSEGYVTDEFDLSPYRGERVRFVFHAWTGPRDPTEKTRHWTLAGADVVGTVLDAPDVRLRFRVATDASLLDGAWAIDRLELTGVKHGRSVGIHLNETPAQADLDGIVTLRGTLRNHGGTVRTQMAVGLVASGAAATAPTAATANGTLRLAAPAGHLAAAGPWTLAPAGKPGSEQPFAFRVHAGSVPDVRTLSLVLLEGTLEGATLRYAQPDDDVPGRAVRTWSFETRRLATATLDPLLPVPASLAQPGDVRLVAKGVNNGTTTLALTARLTVADLERAPVGTTVSTPATVPPGGAFSLPLPAVALPRLGDFVLKVELLDAGAPLGVNATRLFRVGTGDTLLSESFEDGTEGWTTAGRVPFGRSTTDARFGQASLLFGVEDRAYQMGARVENRAPELQASGTLTSPVVDLRAAGPAPVLAFWHKPLLYAGQVHVRALVLAPASTEPDPGCAFWQDLPHGDLGGRASDWRLVVIPLDGITCNGRPGTGERVRLQVAVDGAYGQGWRIDGVTLASGVPSIRPERREHEVSDGGLKEFPFTVTNPGLVPKPITVRLDPARSKLSPAQQGWVVVSPENLTVPPGGEAKGRLLLDVPALRGGYTQDLVVNLTMADPASPWLPALSTLDLAFRPKARADLVVSAAIDGRAVGEGFRLEEATPHEVTLLVANDGTEASRPTEVRMSVRDAKGRVVWEHRQPIDAVLPGGQGGDAAIVAAVWKPAFGERGPHTFHAVVDPDGLQVDYDRKDSELRLGVEVTPLLRPDLAVPSRAMRVTTPDGQPVHETVPGSLVRVTGAVVNDGLREARQVTVRLLAGAAVLKEELVPVLAPGASYSIHANQRAPAQTTSYRLLVFTPDVELHDDNNEHALELPVYPPDLVLDAATGERTVAPGGVLEVPVTLRNDAPHPVFVNLTLAGDPRFAQLAPRAAALAPGEARNLTLTLAPAASELAGARHVLVVADTADGFRARRTVEVAVAPRPEAALVPHLARGPPSEVRVELDVLNTGNVEIAPEAVVRDATGEVLARVTLEALPPGATRFTPLSLRLPDATPPGPRDVRVSLEHAGATLAETPVSVDVRPWSRVHARVQAPEGAAEGSYVVTLTYDGNAPATRRPIVLGLPEGVRARYQEDALSLAPGESRNLTLDVRAGRDVPSGTYLLQTGFLDPLDPDADVLGGLTPIRLDLRRGEMQMASVRRASDEAVGAGDDVVYVVTLRNVGDAATTAAPLQLFVDGRLVAHEAVAPLAEGEVRETRLSWKAEGGVHGVVVALDPREGHEGNAFAETLDVAGAPPGVEAVKRLPAPATPLLVGLVLVAALAARRRRGAH